MILDQNSDAAIALLFLSDQRLEQVQYLDAVMQRKLEFSYLKFVAVDKTCQQFGPGRVELIDGFADSVALAS